MSIVTLYDPIPALGISETSSLETRPIIKARPASRISMDLPSFLARGVWMVAASSFNADPIFRYNRPYEMVLALEARQLRKITIREARAIARSVQDRAEARRLEYVVRESRELQSLLASE